ncbi:MAG: ATP-binding cassette domain-containing protein [SAR324 cluster bacterium]|nr:ATP-binding cassette domain-containing protein [SAR324 cluster bacterium]
MLHSTDISTGRTSQKSEPLLSVDNLCRQVSANWIWNNISFDLAAGDRLALTGSSGSGKSLLLRTLSGLDVIASGPSGENGSIRFAGKSLHEWEMPQYRSKVCYIQQHPTFFDETVEANLKRVFRLKAHQNIKYDREKILSRLQQLTLPNTASDSSGTNDYDGFLERPAKELSGGEAQIAALLRVLQLEPQVLLLDEPTSSMDVELTKLFEKLLEKWQREIPENQTNSPNSTPQRAWIWVSHNPEQLRRMCSKTFCLDRENGN